MRKALIVVWLGLLAMKLGVNHMSQQICYHLLKNLQKQQKQHLVQTLQQLNQPSKDSTSLTESTTAEQTT